MSQAEFDNAYKQAGKLGGGGNEDKLEFYALAKIAKGETVPVPGSFDFTGKYKHKKFKELSDSGLSADDARKKYVEKFNEMKDKHGLKE